MHKRKNVVNKLEHCEAIVFWSNTGANGIGSHNESANTLILIIMSEIKPHHKTNVILYQRQSYFWH